MTQDAAGKKTLLFVCVENSCRSQMAEGLARVLGGDRWEVWSAGSGPSGRIHETAIAVMQERGIDLSRHRSKGLSEIPPIPWDYVVTMGCEDKCPSVKAWRRLDWDIPNPKDLPLEEFRHVRDGIEARVRELLTEAGGLG